jgi:hypothetical protein
VCYLVCVLCLITANINAKDVCTILDIEGIREIREMFKRCVEEEDGRDCREIGRRMGFHFVTHISLGSEHFIQHPFEREVYTSFLLPPSLCLSLIFEFVPTK